MSSIDATRAGRYWPDLEDLAIIHEVLAFIGLNRDDEAILLLQAVSQLRGNRLGFASTYSIGFPILHLQCLLSRNPGGCPPGVYSSEFSYFVTRHSSPEFHSASQRSSGLLVSLIHTKVALKSVPV